MVVKLSPNLVFIHLKTLKIHASSDRISIWMSDVHVHVFGYLRKLISYDQLFGGALQVLVWAKIGLRIQWSYSQVLKVPGSALLFRFLVFGFWVSQFSGNNLQKNVIYPPF